jgi:carboxymethylenebutenolidase
MDCWLAAAPDAGAAPVVLVLQEAFGVNGHIKDVCRRLAEEGFVALAPELYHRQGQHLRFDYSDKAGFLGQLGALSNESIATDLRACLDFLPDLPTADPARVFCLGFCLGGFSALLASVRLPLSGAVSFYGAGVVRERDGIGYSPFLEELGEATCPLLLFFGERDVSIPEADRRALARCLEQGSVAHEILVFEGANHGFFCDERKVYHPAAAREAWAKTLDWLWELAAADKGQGEMERGPFAEDTLDTDRPLV